jgi:hypothetical protein
MCWNLEIVRPSLQNMTDVAGDDPSAVGKVRRGRRRKSGMQLNNARRKEGITYSSAVSERGARIR